MFKLIIMGTITKTARISGRTLQEAFSNLQDSCREEYGDDIYNGQWNNCQGIVEVSTKEYDNTEDITKHQPAIAKCIRKPKPNNNTIKTQVENFPNKGARKWVTMYVAKGEYGEYIVKEEKQAIAIKKARAYVEKHPDKTINLHIVKMLVGGETRVAKITYKPSKTEAKGEWEIYGAMSC